MTASSSLNGSNLVVGSASTMVTARPEQSQILVQHPDAPSPAQPQVCCRSAREVGLGTPRVPPPSLGEKRRKILQNGLKTLFFQCCFSSNALKRRPAENLGDVLICLTRSGVSKEYFALFSPAQLLGLNAPLLGNQLHWLLPANQMPAFHQDRHLLRQLDRLPKVLISICCLTASAEV